MRQNHGGGLTLLLGQGAVELEQASLGVLEIAQNNRRPESFLKPIAIVAPSRITGQVWLERAALQQGIQAGFENVPATSLAWRITEALTGTRQMDSPLAPRRIVWGLMQSASLQAFQPEPLLRLRLSWQLAQALDRCLTYRPEWIAAWLQGKSIHRARGWEQAMPVEPVVLLEELVAQGLALEDQHPFEVAAAEIDRGLNGTEEVLLRVGACLPVQAVVFLGWNDMPRQVATLFALLAKVIPTHVIALDPSEHYWDDARPDRHRDLFMENSDSKARVDPWILGNWGQHQRRSLQLWRELIEQHGGQEIRLADDREGDTLLDAVQSSIKLASLQPFEALGHRNGLEHPGIEFHQAIGPWRQVEALALRLEALFKAEPDLKAEDVLVLCVEPANYIPAFQAVFSAQGWQLAWRAMPDANGAEHSTAWAHLTRYLNSIKGLRLATDLLTALRSVGWQDLFGLNSDRTDELCAVIGQLGPMPIEQALESIVIGMSFAPEPDLGLPLRRVGPQWLLPAGVFDEEVVTQLAGILKRVLHHQAMLGTETQAIEQWIVLTVCIAEQFLPQTHHHPGRMTQQVQWTELIAALHDCKQPENSLPTELEIPWDAWLWYLQNLLRPASSVLQQAAGIQVAPFGELRGLPFRVIAVLGAEDAKLPEVSGTNPFDPLAMDFQVGDPDTLISSRGAFLDVVLAATQACWFFWSPRQPSSSDVLAPSVLVSELQEFLEEQQPGCVARLTYLHPLFLPPKAREDVTPEQTGSPGSGDNSAPLSALPTLLNVSRLARDISFPASRWWREAAGVNWRYVERAKQDQFAEIITEDRLIDRTVTQMWASRLPGSLGLDELIRELSKWPLLIHPLAILGRSSNGLEFLQQVDQKLASLKLKRIVGVQPAQSIEIASLNLVAGPVICLKTLNTDVSNTQPVQELQLVQLANRDRPKPAAFIEAWCNHHVHAVACKTESCRSFLFYEKHMYLLESNAGDSMLELEALLGAWKLMAQEANPAHLGAWFSESQKSPGAQKGDEDQEAIERNELDYPELRYLTPIPRIDQLLEHSARLYHAVFDDWKKQ